MGGAVARPQRLKRPLGGYIAPVSDDKKDNPGTVETDAGPSNADDDVQSDPARGTDATDEEGVDWSDEGGATPIGPADTGDHTQ